jgi:hypothetical protein
VASKPNIFLSSFNSKEIIEFNFYDNDSEVSDSQENEKINDIEEVKQEYNDFTFWRTHLTFEEDALKNYFN